MIYKTMAIMALCVTLVVANERPQYGGTFEPANRDYLSNFADADSANAGAGGAASAFGGAFGSFNENTTVDTVIDTILATGRQGRNLDGFDDVYSDANVQEAINKGDDRQARNVIRDKLCSLGLMDCDANEQVQGKRPFLPPGELIYSQPPPGYYQQNPNQRPPQQQRPPNGAYGPARPMPPPPNSGNKYTGPPRKVGYAGPSYPGNNGPNYASRPPGSSLYVESKPPGPFYEGPSPPGPIYQGAGPRPLQGQIFEGPKPPGPIYEDNSSPYKFDNAASVQVHEQHEKYETIEYPGTQKIVQHAPEPATNTVNIHHHYHHLDGADATKGVAVNPIEVTQGAAAISSSHSNFNSLSSSSDFSSNGLTSGGFSPMSSGYFNKNTGSSAVYGSNAYKPIVEQSNHIITASGPGAYDGAVNSYGGAINVGTTYGVVDTSSQFHGNNQQFGGVYGASSNKQPSFHSQNPDNYKKALNTNSGGSSLNSLSSLSTYSKYNNQYANTGFQSGQQQQFNTGENYNGYDTARQDECVCVPFEQCTSQDVIGRKDDLILPLDPRNLKSDIEALEDEVAGNKTVAAVEKKSGEKEAPKSEKAADKKDEKKVTKREATDKSLPLAEESLDQADGQARQAYYQQQQQRPQQQCAPNLVCCRRPQRPPQVINPGQCGKRNTNGITGRIKNPVYVDGDSEFGEYPWQVAILKKDPKESVYICGGTLIDHLHILTAAHCVKTYTQHDLRIRLGEWDVNHDVEFFPYIERDAVSVTVHPEYYAGTLDNDLAIIRLNAPVDFATSPHISPACLPDKYSDYTGARCWTTGWGKDAFGDFGKYQNILKEVDVPIIGQQQCQQQLRSTRLGYSYKLNPGFICAGGEEGKDACKGDGGGPMVCERNGSWQLVGVVSWGIGCGQVNVPGVYVRVSHYLDWIQANTRRF